MPTVFVQNGYRASFYSYDLAEPMHVHVFKAGHECKMWLGEFFDSLTITDFVPLILQRYGDSSSNAAKRLLTDGLRMAGIRGKVLATVCKLRR